MLVVADPEGRVHASLGDPDTPVYLRSAAKPFQAAAAVVSGGLDAIAATERELAIVCASHSGEDAHVATVAALLSRLGLDERALRCGAHPPIDAATAERVGHAASALHNNCSGKHAGMLAIARRLGVAPESYLEGAVQELVLDTVAKACGVASEAIAIGTDGCSAPNFAVPLRAAARAYALLAAPGQGDGGVSAALRRIAEAMTAEPWYVGGTGRFDTLFMEATARRFVAKGGAEGVQGIADRERGLGLAVKVVDGGSRAAAPAALEALSQMGLLDRAGAARLEHLHRPVLRNHAGIVVGRISCDFRIESK